MTQHGQRSGHLFERRIKSGNIVRLLRIAEKAIERLFDLRQIVLDFAANLADQQFLLRPATHFVKQRQAFVVG